MTRPRPLAIHHAAMLLAVSVVLSAAQEPPRRDSPDARSLIAVGLYDDAEIAARAVLSELRSARGDDSEEVTSAADTLVSALIFNGRAASAPTLQLAEGTLQASETRLGAVHAALLPSLANLAEVLIAAVQFDRAVVIARRAMSISERSGIVGLDQARVLGHLGRALGAAGRYDEALSCLERSVRLTEEAVAPGEPELARALEDIALVLQRKGSYDAAGVAIRRAERIQQASDPLHPAFARTLNLVAQQFWFEGDLLQSKEASQRAVALAERTLRPDHPTVALSLRYLAGTLLDLGDLIGGLTLARRALAIAERNFGPDHHVTGEYLHGLGLAELDQGEYATARLHFQRALRIFERQYGPWHEYVATALSVLALADARLGDFDRARQEQSRAVSVHARVGGSNHPFVAVALTELATLYREQGSSAQALPLLERALAIRERTLGAQHRDVARTLADLASTLSDVGRPTRAQALAVRAVEIWERQGAPDAPEFATVLALYAKLQANRGDSAGAQVYYERALAIRARTFGMSHPLYADAQVGLAVALAATGDRAAALEAALAAESTGREHLRVMLRSLPERQGLNYAAARPRGQDLILSLSGSPPEAIPAALDEVIRSRALVLDEIAARQGAAHSASNREQPARTALTAAQQRLANLTVRGPGPLPPVQYAAVLDEARQESEHAEQALAELSGDFSQQRRRDQVGLAAVAAALSPDTALVSLVRYDRQVFTPLSGASPANRAARRPLRTVPSYLAFVVRSSGTPAAVPLGPAAALEALVAQWRLDIRDEAIGPLEPSETPVRSSRSSGLAVRRLVWDRLRPLLGDARTVFIVPDGVLSLVPFAALPTGARSYLLETGPVIHYLSAERDLVTPPPPGNPGRGLLAIGGPSFNDRTALRATDPALITPPSNSPAPVMRGNSSACGSLQSVRFEPLTGTLQEIRDLSRLWDRYAALDTTADAARVFTGRDATETAFKREAGQYRVLHLATHGFFLSNACAPAPTGTRGVGGLATAGPRPAENPLLLSGLALAGANQRALAGPNEDEGILTAEEVASLDLHGVEWAVLSACDTGVGEIKAGEGVFGLRRAFQVAGARTVVMSLWSVEDQSTRAWMRALYEGRFERHLSTADAVHQASLTVLRDRRAKGQSTHPFFWAAFVAAGDWR